jgi:secreted trypsin-like serine protease
MNVYSLIVFATAATFAGVVVECRPAEVLAPSDPRDALSGAPRIFGGQDATDGQFPMMLELEYYGSAGWKHICGAVLLSQYYGLTAARCVVNVNIINLRLYAGILYRENDTLTNAQQLSINRVTVHESYSEYVEGSPYDIAVIRFAWAAALDRPNIAVASLPADDSSDFSGSVGTLIGWGRYGDPQAFAWTLQWARSNIIMNNECQDRMTAIQNAIISDASHVCTMSDPVGIGICSGDAGSPLLVGPDTSPVVMGLSSWAVLQSGNCNMNFPSVYTRVSKFLDWISTNTPPYP